LKNLIPQHGISLVEMMVALVIGLFLIGGVVQVYLTNQSTYRFAEAVSRIQENGRFALDMIAQDLRMGRFWGCTFYDPDDTTNLTNSLDPAGVDYDPLMHDFITRGAIEGSENDGLNGSDGLIVRGIKSSQASVRQPYNSPTSEDVHISATASLEAGDIVMLSNCEGADIFQVSAIGASTSADQIALSHTTVGKPGNVNAVACAAGGNAHCLSRTYGADAMVSELQTVIYSIATGATGEPALWRSENGINEELIDGVAEMQILYGIDTDNDGSVNRYLDSVAVADMNTVGAIRIMLLLQSANDFVVEQPQTYILNDNTVTSADRRLRQVFSATIGLRNPGDN
jgi:type IV pilus assembly protein PilW